MNSDLFFEKIQCYFDEGVFREVVGSEFFTIVSFGEMYYLILPHLLNANEPFGIYINARNMKKCVEDERFYYEYLSHIVNNNTQYQNIIYNFNSNKVNYWKKWIIEKKPQVKNYINLDLEAELVNTSRRKKGGLK